VQQLVEQERVAAGRDVACAPELLSDRAVQSRRRQRVCRRRAQGARLDHRRMRLQPQLAQQRGLGARLAGAQREHERDWHALQPAGEVQQKAQRRAVGPVNVVDCQQQRRALGEVRHQPVQPVQDAVRCIRALGRRRRRREDRSGEHGRAGQQLAATFGRRSGDRGLEQLASDAEAVAALERPAAGDQHVEPERPRPLAAFAEQPRLADPGRALHQHHAAAATARTRQRSAELGQRVVALQQQRGGSGVAACNSKSFGQLFGRPPLPVSGRRADDRAADDV
jgi:hypothetical protein